MEPILNMDDGNVNGQPDMIMPDLNLPNEEEAQINLIQEDFQVNPEVNAFLDINDPLNGNNMEAGPDIPISMVLDSFDQSGDDSDGVVDQLPK
jgi:hypothetical protein